MSQHDAFHVCLHTTFSIASKKIYGNNEGLSITTVDACTKRYCYVNYNEELNDWEME